MYSLLKAIRTVKYVDTSKNRLKVFEDIAKKHLLIRVAYLVFQSTAHTPVGALLLLLYGLKCFMTIKLPKKKSIELLCFASYPNEHIAINRIKRGFSEIEKDDLLISRKYILNLTNWIAALSYILIIPRLYSFAKICSNNLHFMPACRVFSTVAFYFRFKNILERIDTKGILIANHYSPECTALVASAQSKSIKVVYTNHAHVPEKISFLPSPPANLMLLTSEAVCQKFHNKLNQPIQYKLIGYEQEKKHLKLDFLSHSKSTVGIFLTALTDMDRVRTLVDKFLKVLNPKQVLIRPHPVALLKENFSDILRDYPVVKISKNMPLNSDINQCDLVVCGNTSAVIEVLKGGCPVLYDAKLDQISYDYNGFVEGGLISYAEKIDNQLLTKVSAFYKRVGWEKVMQFYDASYLDDKNLLFKEAEKELKRVLN